MTPKQQENNHRKHDRNEEIYRRWLDSESGTLLAKEYRITRCRLYQIIDAVRQQRSR
jgi:Mor family transcriptional regulator